jgi:hypothetical protein
MKLTHAIKLVEKIIDSPQSEPGPFHTREEIAAMRVLVTMSKRVIDTRPSLRAVVSAVYGEDLNQDELNSLFKKD